MMIERSFTFTLRSLIVSTALLLPLTSAFDRDECFKYAQQRLKNQSLSPTSPYFFRDAFGAEPYNAVENMTLTLEGCNALCGSAQTWYDDIGPRMTVWLVPVLLLVANIELSPVDKRRFLAILHILGDPIDSLWSLLQKLDAVSHCSALAERYSGLCPSCRHVIAVVFSAFEEVHGPSLESEREFDAFLQRHSSTANFVEWRRAAIRLADGRTNELARGALVVTLYILQLVAAFVPAVGGEPHGPPGGRIATVVLLSWLIPAILLTNAMGYLPSRRAAFDILNDLAVSTDADGSSLYVPRRHSVLLPSFPCFRRFSSTEYHEALVWAGGIYTYRPWKGIQSNVSRHRHLHALLTGILVITPIVIGFIGAMLILWYQLPVGPNCRHIWILSAMLLWCLSAAFTWLLHRTNTATGFYHWRITLIKDACVALPILLIMFLSAAGLFNFCWCWSGPFQFPGGKVPMPETTYIQNARTIYPMIVGGALLLELLTFAAMVHFWFQGFQVLRWRERYTQKEWERTTRRITCWCMSRRPHRRRNSSQASEMSLLKLSTEILTTEIVEE